MPDFVHPNPACSAHDPVTGSQRGGLISRAAVVAHCPLLKADACTHVRSLDLNSGKRAGEGRLGRTEPAPAARTDLARNAGASELGAYVSLTVGGAVRLCYKGWQEGFTV